MLIASMELFMMISFQWIDNDPRPLYVSPRYLLWIVTFELNVERERRLNDYRDGNSNNIL